MNREHRTQPHSQAQYQVRFDWGVAGARSIAAGADVVIWVDVLSAGDAHSVGVFDGDADAHRAGDTRDGGTRDGGTRDGGTRDGDHRDVDAHRADAFAGSAPDLGITTIGATLRNRRAVAEWVLGRQGDKGDRFTVAVVAAGELRDDATVRFALEDLLGAGAVIDALADLGIDYCSPEAAAASAAFNGLRNATGHLIGSSASGQELTVAGRRDDVDYAVELDVSEEILVRREFSLAQ